MISRHHRPLLALATIIAATLAPLSLVAAPPTISVSFPKERSAQPLDGRLLLLLSNDSAAAPRMQIGLSPKTQIVFGIDVDQLQPGQTTTIDDTAYGYPIR